MGSEGREEGVMGLGEGGGFWGIRGARGREEGVSLFREQGVGRRV